MPATIHEVLDDLRATALDKRDQGDKFERLIRAHLRTDPEWTAKFSDVWLWTDWPERAGRPDTGIDLVAKNRDDEGYTAIQCKFYAADSTVAKADIDSFLSASSRPEFTQRYIFDTARAWSRNATSTLEGLSVPAQRVDIGYLDDINLDWSDYWWSTPPSRHPTDVRRVRDPSGPRIPGPLKPWGCEKSAMRLAYRPDRSIALARVIRVVQPPGPARLPPTLAAARWSPHSPLGHRTPGLPSGPGHLCRS
jgi:hypothetical protein